MVDFKNIQVDNETHHKLKIYAAIHKLTLQGSIQKLLNEAERGETRCDANVEDDSKKNYSGPTAKATN